MAPTTCTPLKCKGATNLGWSNIKIIVKTKKRGKYGSSELQLIEM